MKRMTLLGIAAAIAIGSTSAIPTPAAAEKPWMVRICQHHVKIGNFKKMKDCLDRVKAGAERYCSYLERIGYFNHPNARWKNKKQCIQWYRKRR